MSASDTADSLINAEMARMPWVWMYHSIAPYDEDPYEVTMTPQRFEKQLRWLQRRGLRGVSMCELLEARTHGCAKGMVGLTFDDGYQDFISNALPTLTRYGFTATVFVLAGRLGGLNEWSSPGPEKALLTADEVRVIDSAGMEVGSHGLKHVSLVETGPSELIAETSHSRTALEELLGHEIPGFCYPYGYLDARVVEATRDAGYSYACAVRPSSEIGRHAIPRTLVHEGDTSWRLEAKRAVSKLTVGNRLGVERYRGDR